MQPREYPTIFQDAYGCLADCGASAASCPPAANGAPGRLSRAGRQQAVTTIAVTVEAVYDVEKQGGSEDSISAARAAFTGAPRAARLPRRGHFLAAVVGATPAA
jgi:hypothetical protein